MPEIKQQESTTNTMLSHSIFQSNIGCTKILDLDARLVSMNGPGLCQMEIDDFDSFKGKDWKSLWPEEYRETINDAVQKARQGGVGEFQGFCPTAKGTPRWWDVVVLPVVGDDGAVESLLSISRDITVQRQAEEDLRASQERLALIIRATNDELWDCDLGAGVSPWSRVFQTSTDRRKDGDGQDTKAWEERIHPDDRQRVRESIQRALDAGQENWSAEYRFRRPDGSYAYMLDRGYVLSDTAGKAYRMAGAMQDITDRKRAESALKAQNDITKDITDNATTGLVIMDDRQHCIFLNPAAEKIFGYSFKEVKAMNRPLHDIIHHTKPDGSHYPMVECPIDRALPEKNQTQGEDIFIRPGGNFYPVSFTASPVVRDGVPTGTVIEVRDATKEKEAERQIRQLNQDLEKRVRQRTEELTAANKELARSNSELEDFAYAASHDLQEPLRKIAAFSGLLASDYEDSLPPEAKRYIEGLQKSSLRMSRLIDDLLAYSRVATQNQPFEVVDLRQVMDEVLDDLQTRIEDSGAVVTVGPLCKVEGDPLQLRLLLQNLVSNALKYSRSGVPPEVSVTSQTSKEICTIKVKDNGIGFKEEYSEKIFTIFQRLHGRSQYEGTGIGLAICKKIAERHGGSIRAVSEEGVGSTFIMKLPVGKAD